MTGAVGKSRFVAWVVVTENLGPVPEVLEGGSTESAQRQSVLNASAFVVCTLCQTHVTRERHPLASSLLCTQCLGQPRFQFRQKPVVQFPAGIFCQTPITNGNQGPALISSVGAQRRSPILTTRPNWLPWWKFSLRGEPRREPGMVASSFLKWFRSRRLTGLGASTLKASTELDAGGHWAMVGASGAKRSAGNSSLSRRWYTVSFGGGAGGR